MLDLSIVTDAAARDPLIIVLAVFLIGGLLTALIFRKHPVGRAVVRVVFLILLTIALLHADIVPYQPLILTGRTISRCSPRDPKDRMVALDSVVPGCRAA